jgi:ubiquinone biosynthesis protein
MRLFGPGRVIRNISRLNHILRILIKYGFGYIIDRARIRKGVPLIAVSGKGHPSVFNLPLPVRVRRIFEELGPTFMKLGQVLGTRADILPVEYCLELEKLQDSVPSLPFKEIEKDLDSEFGKPWNAIFESIEPEATASASIAQVHNARLKSGEDVVIKIIKPGVPETVTSDLEILEYIAGLVDKYFHETFFTDPSDIVKQLKKSISRELDLRKEAENIRSFRKALSRETSVGIPKVHTLYTTRKILVMERMHGFKITDMASFKRLHWDTERIARNFARTMFRQIFVHRSFHADPHPGNILIPAENRVSFLDFGLTGRISEETKHALVRVMRSLFLRDIPAIAQHLRRLVIFEKSIDEYEFQSDIEELINRYYDLPIAEIRLDRLFQDMLEITSHYNLRLSSNLFLLMKCVMTTEAVVLKLDPKFAVFEEIQVYLKKFMKDELSAGGIFRSAQRFVNSFSDLVSDLPPRLSEITRQVARGNLKIQFELLGLERFTSDLYRIINRLIFSILSASLLIGSFYLMGSGLRPLFIGYPLISILGLILAFLLLMIVIIDIIRQ